MLTTSEIAVTAAIWSLTAVGGFFCTRAMLRKKKLKSEGTKSCADKPVDGLTDQGTTGTDAEKNQGQ